MNCIIIDDESTARLIINQLCSNIDNVKVVNEFSNAIEAIKFLNHMNFPEFESQLHLLKNILRLFHLHIHKFF